ncbi:MAG: DUF58 domain-containing protein [Candidatus Dormiibacterota bacterium]
MVGAGIALTGIFDARLLLLAVAYHAVLAVAAAVDILRLPNRRAYTAQRTVPQPLALGVELPVQVAVELEGGEGLAIEVADHVPLELRPSRRLLGGEVKDGRFQAAYTVRPPHRGAYDFGPIDIRWGRRRGLWQVQVRHPAQQTVSVYPNVLAIREYELRLRRGMPLMAGLRRARPPGATTAFAGLRDYVSGDELRRISWKATARRDSPVTTVVEADRGQQMIIAIDCARLMTAPSGDLSKLDHAVNSALLLAWVAQNQGDRVGLLTFADSVLDWLGPQRGSTQVSRINQRLYNVPATYMEADFGAAFAYLGGRLNRRSLVIVLTDVLDPEASSELVRHALRLSSRHLVLVVAQSDPEVLAARNRPIDSSARVYEWAAAEELLAARRRSFEVLRRGGVLGLDVPAGELSAGLVQRYLELKERALL